MILQIIGCVLLVVMVTVLAVPTFYYILNKPNQSNMYFTRLPTGRTGRKQAPEYLQFQYGLNALQGQRPTMEDAHIIEKQDSYFVMGVCDGHCGDRAAHFVARHLCNEIKQQFKSNETGQALYNAVRATEKRFDQLAQQFNLQDGTTLCLVVIRGEELFCVNVGDSRALLGQNYGIASISSDQKADEQIQYVESVGGFVHPLIIKTENTLIYSGAQRIYPGGLAIGRSIGDFQFKDPAQLEPLAVVGSLVLSEPDVSRIRLDNPQYAVICCDGVFDVISSLELHRVIMVLLSVLFSAGDEKYVFLSKCGLNPQDFQASNNAQIVSNIVTRLALMEGSMDNISCCCVIFKQRPWPLHKNIVRARYLVVENLQDADDEEYSFNNKLYNFEEFSRVCHDVVCQCNYREKGYIKLQDYQDFYKQLENTFNFQDSSVGDVQELFKLEIAPQQLEENRRQRDRLWMEYRNRGMTLRQLRQTRRQQGIMEGDENNYKIVNQSDMKF